MAGNDTAARFLVLFNARHPLRNHALVKPAPQCRLVFDCVTEVHPMKYAVLGAEGQLGRDLCPRLSGEVVRLTRANADLTKADTLAAMLRNIGPMWWSTARPTISSIALRRNGRPRSPSTPGVSATWRNSVTNNRAGSSISARTMFSASTTPVRPRGVKPMLQGRSMSMA